MRQVLATRDENWKKLQQYILEERERVEVRGPANIPIWGQQREYQWFIRDGFFIRSPLTADGVKVSESDRRRYEDEYLRRAQARERRAARGRGEGAAAAAPEPASRSTAPATVDGLLAQTRQPQFIDSAYFLRFKIEDGRYALVGRETFEGREVLRIEYYPARLFTSNENAANRRREAGRPDPDRDVEAAIDRLMNRNSVVTLWVEPAAKQIVRYDFQNVHLDFLPAAWLVRMDSLAATMTMGQPFKDVWLPRDVELKASMMLAIGSFDIRFRLDYFNYREATTGARIIRGGGPGR